MSRPGCVHRASHFLDARPRRPLAVARPGAGELLETAEGARQPLRAPRFLQP